MYTTNLPVIPFPHINAKSEYSRNNISSFPTVLVIDSDLNTVGYLNNFFENRNFNVLKANSYSEAMDKCKESKIDLVISEFLLGDHSCLEITMLIRKLIPDIRVIIMSANEDLLSEKDALNFNADYFLTKPLQTERLCGIIENCLNHSESFS